MRVVLDTNVLVSGLLNPFGAPGKIARLIASPRITLCTDARILAEYEQVLLRPRFQFDSTRVYHLIRHIRDTSIPCSTNPLSSSLPDPDDDMFLEVAIASCADALITGNLRHYPASARAGICVMLPATFIRLLD